ncbi:MAG: hypothetical protein IIY75_04700, partial [Erysipelotrichales bacterium]|nr:hypothetical protein [Erysipelotrichales bacterium]
MEHTKNETLNGKRTFWAMILFECAVLGLILFFCDVKYEVSDDFLMEAFLSGLYSGTPDYHIMFSGGLAGLLLYPLYQWIPTVSWYFFAQMAVCLLSYVAIARVITSSLSWKKAVPVIVLFTLFTASDVYVLPQFTKTAALAVIAGGILFLQSLFDNRKGGMVFGGLVLLGGLLIRLKMLYSALPFLGLYLLCLLLEKRMPVKELLRKGIVIAAAAVLVLVFRFANLAVSQNTEEYKDFAVWTGVRSSIVDYTRPDYSLIKEKMEEAGVSRNDYLVIRNWDFFDRSFLNIKTLRKVNKILGEYRSSQPFNLIQCMKSIKGRGTILYPGAILCMILGVISIIFVGLYILFFKGKDALFAFSVSGCIGIALLVAMVISSAVG